MKCNVILSPSNTEELYFTGKTVVVIDVLRASNTIITALKNGAKEIVPVASVEFAVKVSGGMFGGQTLIGGERNTKKIDGFALGNSPLEYTEEIVAGKTIVFYTTNGTRAIVKAKFSENLFICSFSNLSAIAKVITENNKDFEILCSGRNNSFSIEDTICAGKLIAQILTLSKNIDLNETAKASLVLSKSYGKSILKILKDSEHGKLLLENGFEEDLKFCSKIDDNEVIPYFSENVIKLMPVNKAIQKEKGN